MTRGTVIITGLLVLFGGSWISAAEHTGVGYEVPDDLLYPLLDMYRQKQQSLGNTRYVGLVNYRQPSWEPRFYLIDPERKRIVAAYRVAHGRGSDPAHAGFAEFFSDREGSLMSSLGYFLTGDVYISEEPGHGLSLRLDGLSETNRNAYNRAIVIHANHYMERDFIDNYGMPGRSHGCLVFASSDRDVIVEKLQGGALIYAVH